MTSPHVSSGRIPALDGWRGVTFHLAIFLFAYAVVIMRRPDAVFHAQFYAEDGRTWFADAYNYGWWRVLFNLYEGYLDVVPRAAAAIALLVPIAHAAIAENMIAIAIQAIPVNLLLSSRSASWGPFQFRVLLAALYLLLPNTREMVGTVTESQWIVALIALLLLVALPPRSWLARALDLVVFVLCGLTGPFCIVLFPIAVFVLWGRRREPWPRVVLGVLFLCCMTQVLSLLLQSGARPNPVLGANPEWFARLLVGEVYLSTLFGGNVVSLRLSWEMLVCLAIGGTLALVLCAASAPMGMRCLLVFSYLLFVAALASPTTVATPGTTAWRMLASAPGARYWFFPSLAFAWSLAYCARSPARVVRGAAIGLLLLMTVGFVRDFRYPAFENLSGQYAERLAQVPPGTTLIIPINPSGWTMRLVKH